MCAWASVAVAGVSAGAAIYKGIKAKNKDKAAEKEAQSLKRPEYQIQPEDIQNRNIAEQQAMGGLSADEKLYAEGERDRGLSSALQAQGSGAGPNDSARLLSVFGDSLKSQAALDSQEHMQNIKFFTDTNKDIAAKKNTQWGVNELQPYESKLQEIQNRRIAAQTNENNAFNEGLGSASAIATGINSYNKTKGEKPEPANLSPYSRTFGLADTGGGFNSPAAGFPTIDPNSAPQGI